MEDVMNWMAENADWLWWSVGVVLLAGEMVLPGVYLLWIGVASLVTGVVAWVVPEWGFEVHGMVFAAMATISVYLGNRYFYQKTGAIEDAEVNVRRKKLVGRTFEVVEPIKNGSGHVQVGDSRWLAQGPDLEKGALATVTSVDGTVLVVEAAKD